MIQQTLEQRFAGKTQAEITAQTQQQQAHLSGLTENWVAKAEAGKQ